MVAMLAQSIRFPVKKMKRKKPVSAYNETRERILFAHRMIPPLSRIVISDRMFQTYRKQQHSHLPQCKRQHRFHFTFSPDMIQSASLSMALLSLRERSMILPTSMAYSDGRPVSNVGSAMELNSTLNKNDPSDGRSPCGWTTSAETVVNTLEEAAEKSE
jgi:hypothetical protein